MNTDSTTSNRIKLYLIQAEINGDCTRAVQIYPADSLVKAESSRRRADASLDEADDDDSELDDKDNTALELPMVYIGDMMESAKLSCLSTHE